MGFEMKRRSRYYEQMVFLSLTHVGHYLLLGQFSYALYCKCADILTVGTHVERGNQSDGMPLCNLRMCMCRFSCSCGSTRASGDVQLS